jgi:hypothetical protein
MTDRVRISCLAIATFFLGVASPVTADDYPQGCVDCHTTGPNQPDLTLKTLLSQIGHMSIKKVKKVPVGCGGCHAAGEGEEDTFAEMMHEIHYDVPKANVFTTRFDGDCLHCHALDLDTGDATVKSGPANW